MLAQPRLRSVRFVLSSRPPSVDGNMLYKRIVACSSACENLRWSKTGEGNVVIKMQKEIGERCREIVLFALVKNPRGILFLLGEITLQDNSKHLLLVTHGCRVGGVGV
ncbi:uncharacterized protein LOC105735570 [Apis florea]|uniref:uncharacterized protein LOC105735570 n=1 Tax=Apis florea TaxID=7463 RepID=UPI000629BE14|nr:uncharacterized protein LOC105735570 [Apis florea]